MLSWWTEILPVFIFRWIAKKEAIIGNTHFEKSHYYINAREDIFIKVKRELVSRYDLNKEIDGLLGISKINMDEIERENDRLISKLP